MHCLVKCEVTSQLKLNFKPKSKLLNLVSLTILISSGATPWDYITSEIIIWVNRTMVDLGWLLELDRIVHLGGICKDYGVQPSDRFRANQNLKAIIEDIIQMTLEYWQVWGINHLAGQPVPASDHPHGTEDFFHAQADPPWCRSVPFPCVLPPVPGSRDQHLPWCFPPQGSAGSSEAASQPSLLQIGQPKSPQPPLIADASLPFYQLNRANFWPTGHDVFNAPWNAFCPPGCQGTPLVHAEPSVDNHPQVPFC